MKRIIAGLLLVIFCLTVTTQGVDAATRVRGYFKKSGTYVAPHYKSTSNRTKLDNYSTKGNSNPFTGKKGYVNPYKIKIKR